MAASGGILSAWLLRILASKKLPCCMGVPGRGSRVNSTPIASFVLYRSIHSSPARPAKNYLHKFSSKSKKKLWYDSPWHPPTDKPPGLMALMKPQEKKRGNNGRVRVLNAILYEALSGLLSTSEVSDEVYDLYVELSKVVVSIDFSVCRAYWLSSGNKDTDAQIEQVLQKYAPRFRHLMISQHVLGNVPPVVFVRDKEDAKIQEVEELMKLLKSEDRSDLLIKEDSVSRDLDLESRTEASSCQALNTFGIDHVEFNRQIFEYKTKMKDKSIEPDSWDLSQQQQLQLAEIRKQNLKRKKVKKLKKSTYDNISPQEFLATNFDSERQEDYELQEDLVELEEEEEENGGRALK